MEYPKHQPSSYKVNEPDLSGTYTAKDYITWNVDELMELIREKIFKMSPSPLVNHQRVHSRLYLQMAADQKLRGSCETFQTLLDVYLIHPGEDWKETENIVEPDLFILCDPSKIHSRGIIGAPDFLAEVLSPGTNKKDASLKMEPYEEYVVREYWMISPQDRLVIVNLLKEDGKYETQRPVVEGQVISPGDFPEIKVDLAELFEGLSEND